MPGKGIVMARRKGAEWFVGILTNNDGGTETVDLSFLDEGKEYLARIYTDGGEEVKTRTHVKCTYLRVNASQTLKFRLKPRGGAAVQFVELDARSARSYRPYKGKWL